MASFASRLRRKALPIALAAVLRPRGGNELVRLGTDYGGWWVPNAILRPGNVAYCAGVGEDASFDIELLARGLTVRSFDPTPRAIAYVAKTITDEPSFRFLPVGWWGHEDELKFYVPRNPAYVSHSVVNLQGTDDFFVAKVRPVSALMVELGDERLDLVKMDIEGAEYSVLESMLRDQVLPPVLCVEFDQPQPVLRTLRAIHRLRQAGYRLVKIDGWNFSFVRPGPST